MRRPDPGTTLGSPKWGQIAPETSGRLWLEDKLARVWRAVVVTLGLVVTGIGAVVNIPRAPVLWLMLVALMSLPFVIYYFHVSSRFFSITTGTALLLSTTLILLPDGPGLIVIALDLGVLLAGVVAQEIVLGRRGKRDHASSMGAGIVDSRRVAATPKPDAEPHSGGSLP